MRLFCDRTILGNICGGQAKKKLTPPSLEQDNTKSESSTKKPKLGTKPETVEAIKNVVVSGLEILFFPFL